MRFVFPLGRQLFSGCNIELRWQLHFYHRYTFPNVVFLGWSDGIYEKGCDLDLQSTVNCTEARLARQSPYANAALVFLLFYRCSNRRLSVGEIAPRNIWLPILSSPNHFFPFFNSFFFFSIPTLLQRPLLHSSFLSVSHQLRKTLKFSYEIFEN